MCGRYSVLTEDEIIEVRQVLKDVSLVLARDELENYENQKKETAPTDMSPVVTAGVGGFAFEYAKFGFLRWDGKGVIINARSETARDKSMFKNHVRTGRCIIPASGYFEWKKEEAVKKKMKHLINDPRGNLLFMAGLYRDGPKGREFVILTKAPHGSICEIHDRMPVILPHDKIEPWLGGTLPIDELALLDYECDCSPCGDAVGCGQMTLQLSTVV